MLVAQTRLDEAAVRAPASGLLVAVSVRAGEVVTMDFRTCPAGAALALSAYESGRPAAEAACRVGDDRFLNQRRALEQR